MTAPRRKRLIIIGAGFAGLNLARRLRGAPVDILLVDKHNYHLFQPLLYQVATAALSPADIAYPIRRIFRTQSNVQVVLGSADRIDLEHHQVCGGDVAVDFDYLAVCCGATHSYFGKEEQWRNLALGLKDLDDATGIRRRVLLAFEEAELEQDPRSRRAKLTFVVIGGGPTGVEMAGALREIAAKDIQKDFRHIDTGTTRVILMEGGPRLLAQFPADLGERARRDLESMGVEVQLNAKVSNVDDRGVWVGDEHVDAENIIWAAGVAAPQLLGTLGVPQDRSGRVIVGPDLTAPGYPNVFVLGDAAHVIDPKTNQLVPGLAPAAIQMGKYAGDIIRAELAAQPPAGGDGQSTSPAPRPPFQYNDKGTLATIGTRRAVADIRGWHFGGVFAWLLWSLVHIMYLIGFRNRLFVMAGWIYGYIARSREARLITGTFKMKIHTVRQPTANGAAATDSPTAAKAAS